MVLQQPTVYESIWFIIMEMLTVKVIRKNKSTGRMN